MTPPLPRSTDDEVVARYHEAAALEGTAPDANLRAAVLAQAQVLAWRRAEEAGDDTEAPENIADRADRVGAEVDFSSQPLAPTPHADAANDRRWFIPAVASVAVLGLAGLLALQFGRGSGDEQDLALGRPAASAPAPAEAQAGAASPAAPPSPAEPA
ncbi:MAG: hypothetical protein QM614_09465, partial [Ottowia sp.]